MKSLWKMLYQIFDAIINYKEEMEVDMAPKVFEEKYRKKKT